MLDNRRTLVIAEERGSPDVNRQIRPKAGHTSTTSPPLRIVSWVSFASSDGTASSARADDSELGVSSPTSSSQAVNTNGSERAKDKPRTLTAKVRMASPPAQTITSSVMSLLNLKGLAHRSLSGSGQIQPSQTIHGSDPHHQSRGLEYPDDRRFFVAENYSAPVWVPDNKAHRCMACQERFNILRRRHHCRLCGCVFCANCSSRVSMSGGVSSNPA